MKFFLRFSVSAFLLVAACLLPTPAAQAQRAADGPPANDPFGRRVVPARPVPGGRYKSHSYATGILTVQATDGSTRRIQPWQTGVVKVEYCAPSRLPVPDSSVSVVQPQQKATGNALSTNPHSVEISLPNGLRAVVGKSPLRISILRGRDTLVAEAAGAFQRISASTSSNTAPAPTFTPGGTAVRFRLAPGERLYGTGSRALPLDRRGYRLELYNQAHYGSQNHEPNLGITQPTVLSSRGYMLFFDNHAAGYLDLGKTDKNVLEYGGENLTSLSYFVITGRDQAEILDRYTALTGRQPLPPRWALGLIQSRFGYKTEVEMQQVTSRMRRENFPLDALVLDLYWFGGTKRQGDFTWAAPNFPDPAGMMSRLNQQGVKTILITEPYVMRTSRNDSLVRTQGLIGTTAAGRPFTVASFWAGPASIVDVFKPSARSWLWGNYKRLHDQGVAGWWSDLGEPENHPEAMQHVAGPARAVHNAYGQVWAGILRDNYAKEYPEERVFNLARSGWAGLQRNSVFPWSGDINRSWSGYQAQIPVMLGMGQGGVGYMHSDAGGFCVGGIDPELYTRWLQMASLCPILRPHGEGVPPEPYYYPNPYKSAVREAVQLRYRLLPYLYTLAWQNTTTGAPLVRSMDFDVPYQHRHTVAFTPPIKTRHSEWATSSEDLWDEQKAVSLADSATVINNTFLWTTELWSPVLDGLPAGPEHILSLANLNDQYLIGPNLLVAPVLNPSQRRRNVVLPRGNWIDFYTNQTYAGGGTVGVPAPLAHTPLLVRAGALLPMTAYRPSTTLYRPDTLQVRYYPDPQTPESAFTLYEDDGQSAQALAKNQFDLLALSGHYTPAQTTVALHAKGSHYPGQPAQRTVQLLVQRVAAAPTAVLLDGQPVAAAAVTLVAATGELRIEFPLAKRDATLALTGLRMNAAPAPITDPETLTLEAPDQRSFGPWGTTLHYTRHAEGRADAPALLLIRNAQGGLVRVLALENTPGPHALAWNGRDEARRPVAPGVYVAEAGEQHQRLIVQP